MLTKTLEKEPPILSALCDEPNGVTVIRNVRMMTLTMEHLKAFWTRAKIHKTLFNSPINKDFSKFLELFLTETPNGIRPQGLFYVVDDFVGVYYMTHITPGMDAHVHYSFFDGIQLGRVELTKAMLRHVFDVYDFQRLTAEIPRYASKYVFKFAEKVGFKYEGKKRQAAYFDGKFHDLVIHGILKDEFMSEGVASSTHSAPPISVVSNDQPVVATGV